MENEEFPSSEPVGLARALAETAQSLSEFLVWSRNQPSYNNKTAQLQIRAIDGIIKWLFEPLRYCEGAVTSKVPWSLVGPLQRLCTQLLPHTVLILRPKWRYNYTVLMSDIVTIIRKAVAPALPPKTLDKCVGGLNSQLHIVSFPYIERRSVFLHAALSHEIGHLVAEEFIRADKTPMPKAVLDRILQDVANDKFIKPLFKHAEAARRLRECAEYRKRAIQELGSDLVAVDILGFAALFALDAIVGMGNLDDIPSTRNTRYPPRRQRIRIMLHELEDYLPGLVDPNGLQSGTPKDCVYILKAYQERIRELEIIAGSTTDQAALKGDKVVEAAYQWLDQSLNALSQHVRSRCQGVSEVSFGQGTPRGIDFWQKACRLAHSRLNQGLPPNTDDDTKVPPAPATFEAIMNAGWLHLLSKIPARPSDVAGIASFKDQHGRAERLTLRALEMSDIQLMYNHWGGGQKV